MHKVSVYLNAHAAQGADNTWEHDISRCLFRSELNFRKPTTLTELNDLLEEDVSNKIDSIISVGGDGTVNTIIQKIGATDISLLVVPGGTANDLANELGNVDCIKKLLGLIRNNETRKIDLIKVNDRFMATNGGIGLGGEVAKKVNLMRMRLPIMKKMLKMTGKRVYPLFAATELLGKNIPYYTIKIESNEFTGVIKTPGLLINNQEKLGGNFIVAPKTKNDDGKFNVLAFTHKSRASLIQCMYKMASGVELERSPDVINFETEECFLEILDGPKDHFFGDGELINKGMKFHIQNIPQALTVYSGKGNGLLDIVNEVRLS